MSGLPLIWQYSTPGTAAESHEGLCRGGRGSHNKDSCSLARCASCFSPTNNKSCVSTGPKHWGKEIKTNDFKMVVGCFYYLLPWEVLVTFDDTFNMRLIILILPHCSVQRGAILLTFCKIHVLFSKILYDGSDWYMAILLLARSGGTGGRLRETCVRRVRNDEQQQKLWLDLNLFFKSGHEGTIAR